MIVTAIRLVSILLVGLAYSQLSKENFTIALVSILYGHYALSFYYAKDQALKLTRQPSTWIPLSALAVLSAAYIFSGLYVVALVAFVGIHISLSEIYMLNQSENVRPEAASEDVWHLNLSRFLTNASLYLLLLHSHPLFDAIPTLALHSLVVASFVYFAAKLPRGEDERSKSLRKSYLSFEGSGLAIAYALFALRVPLSFQLFVFYHVLTWILFPAISFHRRKNESALKWFGLHTAASTAFFFVLTSPLILREHAVDLKATIPLWATLHFVSSFPLSRLNPRFVTRFFYPEQSK